MRHFYNRLLWSLLVYLLVPAKVYASESLNYTPGEGAGVSLGALNGTLGEYSRVGIGAMNCLAGNDSRVVIGALNFIFGHDNSGVCIGAANGVTGSDSRIMLGILNHLAGNHAIIAAGAANSITGDHSRVSIGAFNCISGDRSEVLGCFNFVPHDDVEWNGCCYPFYLRAITKAYNDLSDKIKYKNFPLYRTCKSFAHEQSRQSADLFASYLECLNDAHQEAIASTDDLSRGLITELTAEIINILSIFPEYLTQFQGHSDQSFKATINAIRVISNKFIETNYSHADKSPAETSYRADPICPLCTDTIAKDDHKVSLNCGHTYHKECLKHGFDACIHQENLDEMKACFAPTCQSQIGLADIANLLESPKELFALQRYFLRQLQGIKMCPHCSMGITRFSQDSSWNMTCTSCSKDLCYNCGKPSHKGISCQELENMQEDQQLLHALKVGLNPEIYGRCPNCRTLIEKKDGCDQMTCGENASDKNSIGSHEGKGCGHQFKWSNRVRVR